MPSFFGLFKPRNQQPANMPQELTFVGTLEAEASEPKAGMLPKFRLLAYSGDSMKLEGFDDLVVVDLAGAYFVKGTTPIIANHDQTLRIGHTTKQDITPQGIVIEGSVSSSMKIAQAFVQDSKLGFPFEASIGCKIENAYFVDAGDTVSVNNRVFDGPIIVVTKAAIREISVVTMGADKNTHAAIVASATNNPQNQGVLNMPFGTTGGNTPNNNNAVIQERERIKAIRQRTSNIDASWPDAIKSQIMDLEASAVEGDLSLAFFNKRMDELELQAVRGSRPAHPGGSFAIHAHDRNIHGDALAARIMRDFSLAPMREKNTVTGQEYGIECLFSEQALEASHLPQYNFGGSLQALFDMQIRAAGLHVPGTSRSSSEFIAAAVSAWDTIKASGFSTLNITNVLENTMNKSALAAFQSVESVWPFITGRKALNDFRPHNFYRLTEDGAFRKVGQTGELKHIGMTDEKFSISADTYGAIISIDRKTIKNDDLGVVLDQARGLGLLGGQRIEESVFVLLLSNPGSFYAAGNNNLLTGAGSELSTTSLTTARTAFRNQVSSNGKPLGISPRVLLAPPTLETTANNLWASERLDATGDTDALVFANNPHKGLYRPHISPYLNNTNITDQDGQALTGQSDTQWYLFADPNSPLGASIVIGFVDGRSTPHFDEAETTFNVPGGMQFRSYLDWGVAMHATELSIKSNGA